MHRILWLTLPKQKMEIEGFEIVYLKLPLWLMIGGMRSKTRFVDGFCLRHPPTESSMIFVSTREARKSTFRYMIYHEYWESLGHYATLPPGHTQTNVETKIRDAFEAWMRDIPGLQGILNHSLKVRKQSMRHIQALALELALARKEMPPKEFHEYLIDLMDHRL